MKSKYTGNLKQLISCLIFLVILIFVNNQQYDMIYRYSDIIESRLQFKIAKAKIKSVEKVNANDGYYTSFAYSFSVEADTINRNDQHYFLIFTSDYEKDESIVIYYENKIKSSRLLLIEEFILFSIFSLFLPFLLLYNIVVIGISLLRRKDNVDWFW